MKYLKNKIYIIIFTLIESFLQVYGYMLTNNQILKDFNLKYICYFLLMFIILFIINNLIFKLLSLKVKKDIITKKFSKKNFFIIWLIIFLLWIPIFLLYYPSIFAYDALRQIPHINNTELWSGQPIFHTLIIEFWIIIGKKISSYKLGLILYSLFQMLCMSAIFAYSIEKINTKLNNKKISKIFTIILILFYGIIPFNSILSISVTKDVLFSGLLLLLILNMYDIIDNNEINNKKRIFIIINSVSILLIKNSFINIFTIFTILFAILFKNKKTNILGYSLILYFIIYSLIIIIFKPTKQFEMEKNSLQFQNLDYISIKHPTVLNDTYFKNNKCLYSKKTIYNKNNVDNLKIRNNYCNSGNVNEKEIITNWISYGMKYPIDYFDSWSNLYIGSWYLLDTSHAYKIYSNDATGYLQTYLYAPTLKIEQENKLPILKNIYNDIGSGDFQYKKYKFLRFIFEPASYILLFFLLITYLLQNKRKKEIIPLIIPLLLYLSIVTGPCILVRYMYPYMVLVPIIFFRIISNNKEEVE